MTLQELNEVIYKVGRMCYEDNMALDYIKYKLFSEYYNQMNDEDKATINGFIREYESFYELDEVECFDID